MEGVNDFDYGPKWREELEKEKEQLCKYLEEVLREFRVLNELDESKREQNWDVAKSRVKYPWN